MSVSHLLELDVVLCLVIKMVEQRRGEGKGFLLVISTNRRPFSVITIGLDVHFDEVPVFVVDKCHYFVTSKLFGCPEVTMYDKM